MKKLIIIIACVLIIVLGGVLFLTLSNKSNSGTSSADSTSTAQNNDNNADTGSDSLSYDIGNGILITGISSYSGDYVEDGSDDYLEDIMMITLENTGDTSVQLMNITINNKYYFRLTTLLPGMTMMVLDYNRAAYDPKIELESVETSDVALFSEEASMHEDVYTIEATDGAVTVTNETDQTIAGGKVFYKNKISTGYLGGITYCVSIPELAAGDSTTIPSGHYTEERSDLLFVTYAE